MLPKHGGSTTETNDHDEKAENNKSHTGDFVACLHLHDHYSIQRRKERLAGKYKLSAVAQLSILAKAFALQSMAS